MDPPDINTARYLYDRSPIAYARSLLMGPIADAIPQYQYYKTHTCQIHCMSIIAIPLTYIS